MSEMQQAAVAARKSKMSVRDICYAGLFAAVIAVMAQISIPMPMGVPMTMQTFAITLAAVVLGSKLSTISSLIYIIMGAVGLPVLANFSGGFDKFVGPTGGFLLSGNTTMLVGTDADRVDEAIHIIGENSCKRNKMVSGNTSFNAGMYANVPVQVTVGGATIFVIDVERYEKL